MSHDMEVFLAVTVGVLYGVQQILLFAFVSELLGLGQWTGAVVAAAGFGALVIWVVRRRRI